ncbi:MAG: AlpA family phage regulatory protein [Burkholderiales bacterium]|nr:AlpA family phage regulatory protein [Burkholderiales bacterium]
MLKLKPAMRALGMAKTTYYAAIKGGLVPPGVKTGLTQRSVAWPSEEIEALREAIIAGRDESAMKELAAQLLIARGGSHAD